MTRSKFRTNSFLAFPTTSGILGNCFSSWRSLVLSELCCSAQTLLSTSLLVAPGRAAAFLPRGWMALGARLVIPSAGASFENAVCGGFVFHSLLLPS